MNEKAVKAVPKEIAGAAVRDMFGAKDTVKSTHTSELVIALCGPIGSPIHKVGETLKRSLESEVGYEKCEIVRLSRIIETHKGKVEGGSEFERIQKLITVGDEFRKDYGSDVLAQLAISEIVIDRQKARSISGEQRFGPRRVCHIIDSIKNQEELEILKLVYRDMLYFVGVYAPLPSREKSLEKRGMSAAQVHTLIDRDSGEELSHGQTVRDTFPQADFFLRIESDTDTFINSRVERFLHLILGTKVITPQYAETAMYLAA